MGEQKTMPGLREILYYLLPFGVAFTVTFLLTPLVKVFAHRIGAMDIPKDSRRMHTQPIPRAGGLAIFFGFVLSVVLFSDMSAQLGYILIGATVMVVAGVVDDVVSLNAFVKLGCQIAAATVPVVLGNLKIEHLTNFFTFQEGDYLSFGILAAPITILWIVAITNAVNLIDGLDGLAVGVSSIASISILIIALLVSEPAVAVIMAALAGGCIGFLPYNFNPAKIFMGDTGALFLGYILACISIHGFFKFYAVVSFVVPFLVLGLPIFDTVAAIIRRLMSGKKPWSPDRKHLHHKLIDMGFSQKQTVVILYTVSGILGIFAVALTGKGTTRMILFLLAVVVVTFLAFKIFQMEKKNGSNGEDMQNSDVADDQKDE